MRLFFYDTVFFRKYSFWQPLPWIKKLPASRGALQAIDAVISVAVKRYGAHEREERHVLKTEHRARDRDRRKERIRRTAEHRAVAERRTQKRGQAEKRGSDIAESRTDDKKRRKLSALKTCRKADDGKQQF